MSFTSTEPQNHSSENTWFTPREFIEKLGPFTTDPCTVSFRPFDTALRHVEHDKGGCGLVADWDGSVWLNPPYGKEIGPFVKKFMTHREGVMLVFARMGSVHIQDLIRGGALLYMLRKRVKFIDKYGKQGTNAGTDSCLVFFNEKYIERLKEFEGVLIRSYL